MALKLPPPLLFFIAVIIIYLLGDNQSPLWLKAVAFLFLSASGIVGLASIGAFFQAKTSPDPHDLSKTNKLIVGGIFRISRNPMYLCLLLALIAEVLWFANFIGILFIALFVWLVNTYQIVPEERFLEQKFGEEYLAYKQRVRRWL